ncbi:MAG: bifunctional glutamate N-acetyltransferase/amino-acid acetyltransferase ArgJ [Eubacteriaceae bacterium]|jgi:glutamate N-acetyltransferase/amino-acid N-acetyltransferase|nr:bifunctional glutamate N-acetyltransferase/amino-acid acetyltransferase ArgJ [Eubacteriaceae bacterium]
MEIKKVSGGVCAAKGFKAWGTFGGLGKPGKGKDDMAVVLSDCVGTAAAVYTSNKVKAAHISVCKEHLADGKAQAMLCNSINANTCTPDGVEVAKYNCSLLAREAGIAAEDIIVTSTGVIGKPMPREPFEKGIPELVKNASYDGGDKAAKAIMTTDTLDKQAAVVFSAGGKECTIGGMAKGSGMIHINMGTMLCFLTTDCAISSEMLEKALRAEVVDSFNQVSIDGDTSTNDTLSIIANGMAGNETIVSEGEDFENFKAALHEISVIFARKIAGDGEGCTKLIQAHVSGAPDKETARLISKSIICSSLFKAAIFGCDANWGRVLCAIGYTPADFDASNIDVSLSSAKGSIDVCSGSASLPMDEDKALEILKEEEVNVEVDIHDGDADAYAWGCDLTYEYVKINGEYRS